jgi:hypothetical protein
VSEEKNTKIRIFAPNKEVKKELPPAKLPE